MVDNGILTVPAAKWVSSTLPKSVKNGNLTNVLLDELNILFGLIVGVGSVE